MATIPKKVLKPWGERIEKASGGRLVIEHFDAMALGGAPPQLIDQARDGVADIAMTLTGYTPGRFPRTEVFELPGLPWACNGPCIGCTHINRHEESLHHDQAPLHCHRDRLHRVRR
jgi:hypothetical protein